MFACRWEVIGLPEPWALPQAGTLTLPRASGTIVRNDWDRDHGYSLDPALDLPSDPIEVPSANEGERYALLYLESLGIRGWFITFGTLTDPPLPHHGHFAAPDAMPAIYLPPATAAQGRSREVRAVKPGSLFIARPSLDV